MINNEGYYQDVDDGRDNYEEDIEKEYSPCKKLRVPVKRYSGIIHNSLTPSGRRKFVKEREKIHDALSIQYSLDVKNGVHNNLHKSSVFVQCINCGGGFVAKKADRKRGWGKFCSKSCKAQG